MTQKKKKRERKGEYVDNLINMFVEQNENERQ